MKERIVIDASSILQFPGKHLSGIGRTTLELIHSIEAVEDLPFELVLFGQRFSRDRFQRYGFSSLTRYLPLPRWPCFNWLRSRLPVVELLTGADLVHVTNNYAPIFASHKTVVTIHDAMFLTYPESHLHNDRETLETLRLAKACKAVITCSQNSKNDLVAHGGIDPEKIHVIYWGYDSSLFFKEAKRRSIHNFLMDNFQIEKPYFFGVSCSAGRKSSPDVVEQFLLMASEIEGCDLVMAWSTPPESIKSVILSHPQGKRVHLLSGVTDEELRFLYNGATVVLFPSKYEGFGLPVLESMACGTPVITCNSSSLPEVGGEAAIYIEPGDNEALLRAMTAVIRGEYDLEVMSQACLCQATKFSWRNCALQTIEVYQSCLDHNN